MKTGNPENLRALQLYEKVKYLLESDSMIIQHMAFIVIKTD